MKPKTLYLVLCVAGAVIPYSQFLPFLGEHGLDFPLIVEQLFVNRISASFALDLLVSAVVLFAFVAIEGRRLGVSHLWAPIAGTVVIGLSFGFPLFLYMRERRMERLAGEESGR